MNKTLVQILWSNHKKTNLIGASVGMILGLVIILASIQLFIDVQMKLMQDEQIFKPEFIVINKQISILNTLKVANSRFSKEEINDIEKQNFSKKVGKFISNKFKLQAFTEAKGNMPAFYTELFFESVEDDFLDINNADWNWKPGQQIIPIILPKDYLTLYNFGFAQSQGLPQISEDIIGKAVFSLKVGQGELSTIFKGRIVGFSGKINSILVPYNFLTYANKMFANSKDDGSANRLVVVVKDPTSPAIAKYLKDKNYQSNDQNEKINKIASLLKVIITIVGIIGMAIILLSVMIFVLSFHVIIAKSAENIIRLVQLGFHYKLMFKIYIRFYLLMLSIVVAFSLLLMFPIKYGINSLFKLAGFNLDIFPNPALLLASLLIACVLFIINAFNLNQNLKKLACN